MSIEKFRWLAAVIAAHKDRKVVGRTRLQKEMMLLQEIGLPTDYDCTMHFYGPYSEGVSSDVGLLKCLGFVQEVVNLTGFGDDICYEITAEPEAELDEIEDYLSYIQTLEKASTVVLELAATYRAYWNQTQDETKALGRLRRKKGAKCTESNIAAAKGLLKTLGLQAA